MGNQVGSGKKSRRDFIKAAGATALTSVVAPTILHAADKTGKSNLVVGTGEYRYEVFHDWPQLPSKFSWQTTHNVAIDAEGLLYVIHEGKADLTDHPSIFVFDQKGKYVRSFGNQFQGGGHEAQGKFGERNFPFALWTLDAENRIGGRADGGDFRRRIRMRETATDGAAVAGLTVADQGNGLGQQRAPALYLS